VNITRLVKGFCDSKYEKVRLAFQENFALGLELGASMCLTVDGVTVVDLWAGSLDQAGTQAWDSDTIVNVNSASKGLAALCVNLLVERGQLDLDAPVARYWPEFAQAGKQALPVRYCFTHQAGLPVVLEPLTLADFLDWDRMCSALAAQAPIFPPGEGYAYHGLTHAWLVGELVRLVDGRGIGQFFREEIAGPLAIDAHIGFGPELDARTSDLQTMPPGKVDMMATIAQSGPESLMYKMFFNPAVIDPAVWNSRAWRAAQLCSSNAHTNARALARFYAVLGAWSRGDSFEGKQWISKAGMERARTEYAAGPDLISGHAFRWGLGFMLACPARHFSDNARAFGHSGLGGSIGFCDPENRLSFGYTVNQMQNPSHGGDARWGPMLAAIYEAVGYPYTAPGMPGSGQSVAVAQ
jgi:CubicO group peptidase (beta-lactamase class C family)